jgi:hypothetical protein
LFHCYGWGLFILTVRAPGTLEHLLLVRVAFAIENQVGNAADRRASGPSGGQMSELPKLFIFSSGSWSAAKIARRSA